MRILHYALGFAPYRSGGLTRYVQDLMEVQSKVHEVGMLWPGQMHLKSKKVRIKEKKLLSGMISYEMVNPLPVPLMEGVRDIRAYMEHADLSVFLDFLQKIKPDIIHVHTFMGLYKEFLQAAKQLGIKTVFTTHDYYSVCPKVNLLCHGKVCQTGMGDTCCSACDMNPLSIKKVMILQSPMYRFFKESSVVRSMRKKWAKDKQENTVTDTVAQNTENYAYEELKTYYQDMLKMIDTVHCNSSLSKETYEQFAKLNEAVVVPISNQNIVDKRAEKVYNKENVLRITYLGPTSEYKGYFMLTDALDSLKERGIHNFRLDVYAPVADEKDYICKHDSFGEGGLDEVLKQADVLAAPSIWKETFGFVAAEALSRGVPVIVTEYVGAKDLVVNGENGFVISPDKESLAEALKNVIQNPDILQQMNRRICGMEAPLTMSAHAKQLEQQIYS